MDHILTILLVLPLVAGIGCFFATERFARALALGASTVVFLASLSLWRGFDPAGQAFQFVESADWLPELGVRYALGIDGISLLLVLLTTLLTPLVVLAATPAIRSRLPAYLGWMLVLETALLGTFVATDSFLFYVFWELMLIPMYFLIGIWGGEQRVYATIKFFIYTMAGSLLMLVALIYLYVGYAAQHGGQHSASIADLATVQLPPQVQLWLFAAFAVAFAIKVPMFPFHTWLPDAHVQAPTGGSVILASVMLKMGVYGFLRLAIPIFPDAAASFGPAVVVLAVVGIVYGALVAMVQPDVKKLVAYSSVSHMGFVMLGLFSLNASGVSGAVYQMLNHGISTGALFLLVGVLYERRHTKLISEYGGLASVMPLFAFVFGVVMLSSAGLPGLNGFVGEFLVLVGSFQHHPWATACAATGVVLGAVYLLWMFQRVMFGPVTNVANHHLPDLTWREIATFVPILALIVFMGVYPRPFLRVMGPSVDRIVLQMQAHAGVPQEASR